MNFNDRTALITGAGQGMGLGIAQKLASQGARVLINDIDPGKAEAGAKKIIADGGKADAAPFDVTKIDIAMAAVKELEDKVGGIDVLVNNAGNAGAGGPMNQTAFKDMPPEEWERYLAINLHGVLNCTRAVVNGMCDRGWGRIITISSEAGRVGLDINVSVYGVAKAGGAHLMRHLAREVGPYGVTTNVVSLGLMDNVPAEFSDALIKTIPARRLGSPADVGSAVAYLGSEDAAWVTGQTLVVNGGAYAI
ncbi:MAG: SDR family NAD(P)-dependent oxidoreductase [Pseudomonadales bacterium]